MSATNLFISELSMYVLAFLLTAFLAWLTFRTIFAYEEDNHKEAAEFGTMLSAMGLITIYWFMHGMPTWALVLAFVGLVGGLLVGLLGAHLDAVQRRVYDIRYSLALVVMPKSMRAFLTEPSMDDPRIIYPR